MIKEDKNKDNMNINFHNFFIIIKKNLKIIYN